MARKKNRLAKDQELRVKSIKLTRKGAARLEDLCRALSEQTGRRISASAIVRALVDECAEDESWLEVVGERVCAELEAGVSWGRRRE